MDFRRNVFASSLLGFLITSSAGIGAHAETDPQAIVDALNAVFGKHEGQRAAHANGICVKGAFTPTAEAASLSKAPHFAGSGPWPVIGRFSMGGGDPAAANTAKDNPRGRFTLIFRHLEEGWRIVQNHTSAASP